MNTDKNSLFVFVEDADVENFVSNYVDGEGQRCEMYHQLCSMDECR